jgi:quercetin dioxygenase-like cupin family protein
VTHVTPAAIPDDVAMNITELTNTTSDPGPADWFTGQVWLEQLAVLPSPNPTKVVRVTFAPRARTAWHTHPLGQVLHILDGVARIGREGQPAQEVRAGDTVRFEPGERHWHGAGPARLMSHLAIQATDHELRAETVWEEHVDDVEYGA